MRKLLSLALILALALVTPTALAEKDNWLHLF